MSTRSNIYVETDTGYVGCYCHYDGYPSLKIPQLFLASYEKVYGIVLKGTTTGAIEALKGEPEHNFTLEAEYSPGFGVDMLFDPYDRLLNSYVSYVYIKRKDGSLEYMDPYLTEDHDPTFRLGDGWRVVKSKKDLEGMLEEFRNEMW